MHLKPLGKGRGGNLVDERRGAFRAVFDYANRVGEHACKPTFAHFLLNGVEYTRKVGVWRGRFLIP